MGLPEQSLMKTLIHALSNHPSIYTSLDPFFTHLSIQTLLNLLIQGIYSLSIPSILSCNHSICIIKSTLPSIHSPLHSPFHICIQSFHSSYLSHLPFHFTSLPTPSFILAIHAFIYPPYTIAYPSIHPSHNAI